MTRAARFHGFDAAAAAITVGIVYTSLARRGAIDCSRFAASLLRETGGISGSDLLGNVFAYWLLGAALGFAWAARRPSRRVPTGAALGAGLAVMLACGALSFVMEAAQACLTERVSSRWDVFANTLGGALGWLTARALAPTWTVLARAGARGRGPGRIAAVVLLAVLAWAMARTAPWIPTHDTDALTRRLLAIWPAITDAHLDPWRLALHGGEWLALAMAMALVPEAAWRAVLRFGVLAATVIAWCLVVPRSAPLEPELWVTLPLAAVAVAALARIGPRPCAALAIAGAVVAMLALQLQPGYGPAQPFAWRITLLHGDAVNGMQQACWFAWFSLTVVASGAMLGGRPIVWAMLPVAMLSLTAALQTLLPGHQPNLSPPLIALACGLFAAGMVGDASTRGRHRFGAIAPARMSKG